MPLNVYISFKVKVQAGNRFQVPRLIRVMRNLEPEQVLNVSVRFGEGIAGREEFLGRMTRDGRITIPRLTVDALCKDYGLQSLVGEIFDIGIEPAIAEEHKS